MNMPFVDLHTHTFFSDGSLSPEEIVAQAAANGVGTLAIADHDVLGALPLAQAACDKASIRLIPAVEIDALASGRNLHVLAYGFDAQNKAFREFLAHVRFLLEEVSVTLIVKLQAEGYAVSLADYEQFAYDKTQGGWKALHYLLAKGLVPPRADGRALRLQDAIALYPAHGMQVENYGYPTVASVARHIHLAGGVAVLAHPGVTLDASNLEAVRADFLQLTAQGLDGIECYYPTHTQEFTEFCLAFCKENHLLITAGSDCHGRFGTTRVGETNTLLSQIALCR